MRTEVVESSKLEQTERDKMKKSSTKGVMVDYLSLSECL